MVGRAGDAYERDAERAADAVVRGRNVGPLGAAPARVQRACAACCDCATCAGHEEVVHRKPTGGEDGVALDAQTGGRVEAVRKAPGESLAPDVQPRMNRQFGVDLSRVRVHRDDTAASATRALSARAFTIGNHVAFERGGDAPHNPAGIHLLAHELAHVVQQQPNVRRSELPATGGQPLGTGERSFFEPRFGRSLTHVRVHEGAEAASSARRFGALAFTYGNHVVLGDGAQVHTAQRRQLLAHELAHVLQYRGTAEPGRVEIGAPDSAAEAEADVAGERVLAGHTTRVTARDAAPVVRRLIPSKKCSNDEHALLILQWMVRLGVYRELLKNAKYDNVRATMLRKLDIAEALLQGYQECGRVNAPASGIVGFVSTTPATTPVGPVWSPPPVVAPTPVVEPPVIETPAPTSPGGMSGGGLGWGIVITIGPALLEWGLNRALSPSPEGTEIKIEDLKQVMAELEAQMNALRQAVEAVTKIEPKVAPSPKVDPRTSPKVDTDTDVDKDEKPEDEKRSCDIKDFSCKQVPIPRKGGDSKFARRHNRCADSVTIPAYKGKDVCINGKAFDAVDASGALWEIKAHAWSYATIYQNPKMAARIARDIASSLFDELLIARTCRRSFKVGVRDAGLKTAIKRYLPGLDIEVLKC
jgi:hypothetical protein